MGTSRADVAAVVERTATEVAAAAEDASEGETSGNFLARLRRKTPPTERDFDLFEQVAMQGMSTRAAAQEFQISQTRVRQVIERVQLWILEMTPATPDDAVTKRDLQMAVGLAGDRLDHLYGDAMNRWRNSDGMVERVRITGGGDMLTTRYRSHGDPKYLMAAARMAMQRSQLPTAGALMYGMAAAGDVRDAEEAAALEASAQEAAAARSEEHSANEEHPVGDCSGRSEVGGRRSEVGVAQERARPCETTPSKQLSRQQRRARESFFAPALGGAGPAINCPSGGATAQLSLSPNLPGAKLELLGGEPSGGMRRHSA